jgi:hypothetical protein
VRKWATITVEPKSGLRGKPPGVRYVELKNVPQKADLTMVWHQDLEKQRPTLVNLILKFYPFYERQQAGGRPAQAAPEYDGMAG